MFTSKLPVSTSVRRPTIGDGSTSFIGLNRASNIPVSVRKANLFTPQTNRRPFMSGASTAGKSYSSVMTTDRKQARSLKPNPDRDEQIRMFDTLVNFLKTNASHMTPPEPKKFFASVSTSESSRIFEFLISRCLPDFKFTKLETSVPDALTLLDYPYIRSVTRSALVSVTTRSAAVGLLVIFDWLIELINEAETPEDDELDELEEPDDVFSELHKNVFLYRDGAKEANKASFDKLYPSINLRDKESELIQVREESIMLKHSLEDNDELELEVINQEENLSKWNEYFDKMKTYMESKLEQEKEEIQYCSKLEIQNEELAKRNEKLDFDIKNHELGIREVENYKKVIDALESEVSLKSTRLKEAELEGDQLENAHREKLKELKDIRVNWAADMRELLSIYKSHEFSSKQWAERQDEIHQWTCRIDQVPLDDIAQNHKLKRDLSLFRQKLRGTDSVLEAELADSLSTLESECDKYKVEIEGYPKILQKLRETLHSKELELANLEATKQINSSRLMNLSYKEDQSRVGLKREHDQTVTNINMAITTKQKVTEEISKEIAEINELNKQYRLTLQKTLYQESLGALDKMMQDAAKWRAARTTAEKNNEIIKKALKRIRRFNSQQK